MSGTDELIAAGLRDLAGQAAGFRPAAGELWQAGQRRRHRGVLAVSAAAAAGAIAVVTALVLILGGPAARPARPGPAGRPAGPGPAAPVRLRAPIMFAQVSRTSAPPCATGVNGMPQSSVPPVCITLSGTGMTVRGVESARVQQAGPHRYQVDIRLTPADARLFAALTREIARRHSPHNELAIIAAGHIYARSVVAGAITTGQAEITGFASRAQAGALLRALLAR